MFRTPLKEAGTARNPKICSSWFAPSSGTTSLLGASPFTCNVAAFAEKFVELCADQAYNNGMQPNAPATTASLGVKHSIPVPRGRLWPLIAMDKVGTYLGTLPESSLQ